MIHAYVTAALQRSKKLPKIDKLLTRVKRGAKPHQSMAQQIAIAQMWAALGYGKLKQHGSR